MLGSVRRFVGGFFLFTAGINVGMAAADADAWGVFGDQAALDVVRETWQDVVAGSPAPWALLLAAAELAVGVLLLRGGRAARVGWVGAIGFHVLLMAFGPWIWVWCLPVLAVLVPVARAEWPLLVRTGAYADPVRTPSAAARG
ncbi:hypothetical protein [Nocardioides solisilvae]|uniref:hypothetical protein n=1 Tax=Nocardioides solisilvae TaxID=1542435 RepID=UPI001950B659|nr:hypothetical protein [Nocardioides solisilvae]